LVVEAIDHHLVESEVCGIREPTRGVEENRMCVRSLLAGLDARSCMPDNVSGRTEAAVIVYRQNRETATRIIGNEDEPTVGIIRDVARICSM
jgi:hypothetical protein